MAMHQTPAGDRVHIGFFGRRNAGKSSVVNAVTGQALSVVSDTKGTTTDPVYKTMELLPLGPVMIIDTPGLDDEGELGLLRVKSAKRVLNKCDAAVLVVDASEGMTEFEAELIALFRAKEIFYIIAYNKTDVAKAENMPEGAIPVSAKTGNGIHELKETLAKELNRDKKQNPIAKDLIAEGDSVILVTPIDEAAPKGRLILPQQQTIRDLLDKHAMVTVVRETELQNAIASLTNPKLVITDSQAFHQVSAIVPEEIPLTSFSILMARYKGYLTDAVKGVIAVESLKDGDKVLIAEGCTHHRQCNDIGSVKIPNWLKKYTGKDIRIETVSGTEFPEDLSPYRMVIHCGGCMLNEREVRYRMKCAKDAGIPITNYGVVIAYMQGILKRSTEMLPEVADLLK
ncbi:MAG: [Clostridia bacterium]|nr:[FeFe] hydrogenase H-cluster maturation GTPase HydF [Clostridia bacterium]